jgi:hypothetical protein
MKKKPSLSKFAILGMTSGLIISAVVPANASPIASGTLYEKSRGGCGSAKSSRRTEKKTESEPYYYKKLEAQDRERQEEQNRNSNRYQEQAEPQRAHVIADAKEDEERLKQLMAQNITYHDMTEEELLSQLNDQSKKLYESLDAEGKKMALKIASNKCNGTNDCKGQNACETEENKCAGQGSCKGKSKCAVSDANLAVKLAAKVMAEKRGNATKK